MSKSFIVYLLGICLCVATTIGCGDDKEDKANKKSKAKKEQTEEASKEKTKKPISSGVKLPESNDNEAVSGTLAAHPWKLASWQVGDKKNAKAPNFNWLFSDKGALSIQLKKDKKLKGGWAYTESDQNLYLALPGTKKNNNLAAFAQPFKVLSIADSLLHLKNEKAELRFIPSK